MLDRQKIEAILRRHSMKAGRREKLAEHLPRLAIVFDDQDISGRHSAGLYQVLYRLGSAGICVLNWHTGG